VLEVSVLYFWVIFDDFLRGVRESLVELRSLVYLVKERLCLSLLNQKIEVSLSTEFT
jgi:hypothetical protein